MLVLSEGPLSAVAFGEVLLKCYVHMQALHNAGVVHRDVKPLNLILSEAERRFKLIDLGAVSDLLMPSASNSRGIFRPLAAQISICTWSTLR